MVRYGPVAFMSTICPKTATLAIYDNIIKLLAMTALARAPFPRSLLISLNFTPARSYKDSINRK